MYTAPDGEKYPLKEAKYDMSFNVYKSDKRKAVPGDPHSCLVALGILRHPDVLDVHIGSGGDAYVVFKEDEDEPAHAVHFKARAEARRIRDAFDVRGASKTMQITLHKPAKSWRLDHRDKSNKRRQAEIKAGSPIKRRGSPTKSRVVRLGVPHRPRVKVSSTGSINIEETATA
jgi:hypothetical protein